MKEKVAILSIAVNVLLAIGKITIGIFSNSAAILAAGVDSFVDIFSSLISYVGIKIAGKPADKEHPYGHYKFEVLSGVVIMLIILATGVGIIYDAFKNFFEPQKIVIGYLAFGIMIFSSIVNEVMARIKTYYGKKENSISLLSDGAHSRLDVYTSIVILIGLFLTPYWIYADALLAMLMGLYIVKEAFSTGKESIDSLLDVSAGEEIENKIKSIAKKENIKISSLKTQRKGSAITANLELNLASNLKIEEATKVSNNLRKKLMAGIESLQYVVIQIVSHEIENSFYQPTFGKGFAWQGKGKFKGVIKEAVGYGPNGNCICPKCDYSILHQKGIPCSSLKCPKCNIRLERK
jgi:cation diffusion facilitator family transporter